MKTITVSVSEFVYEEFKRFARGSGRSMSELIREAMESYRHQHIECSSSTCSDRLGRRTRTRVGEPRPATG